eukprot:TRINITY_DN47621_c0_g1_i1.p1 TRINITY_DN47621_c0_g1~~TRINITY_DN47621_c0_g1_i1.p1  ORF type:complete len:125 (-),score=33.31 TRINITY_DN47621_c0_g1_i1:141-515(-)
MQSVCFYLGMCLIFFFFFFKQKTAYEMQRGLVGSEMCIRDRVMGKDYSGEQKRFLWDIKIDGDPHCKNFIPYGGWYAPYFKQYQLNVEKCDQKSLSISSVKPDPTWFKHQYVIHHHLVLSLIHI